MGTLLRFPQPESSDDGDTALLPRRSQMANAVIALGPSLNRLSSEAAGRIADAYCDLEDAVSLVVDGYIELVRYHLQHPVEIDRIFLRLSNGEITTDEAFDLLIELNKTFHAELLRFGNRVMSDTWKENLTAAACSRSSC